MYPWQFSKKFSLPKNGGHFEFLPKNEKQKFASISLTVRDRAISLKFSTHRVSQQSTLADFVQTFRAKLVLPFGWTLCMPMHPISSYKQYLCNVKSPP